MNSFALKDDSFSCADPDEPLNNQIKLISSQKLTLLAQDRKMLTERINKQDV